MRTRTRTLLIGLAVLVALPCGAQSNLVARRNSLYFEGLGNGGLFSINYERMLTDGLSARVGFGSWPTVDFLALSEVGRGRITTVPIMLNVLRGSGRGRFELGAGLLVGKKDSTAFQTVTGTIGLRYLAANGLLFRLGLTPFYGLNDESTAFPDKGFYTTAGISLGFSF